MTVREIPDYNDIAAENVTITQPEMPWSECLKSIDVGLIHPLFLNDVDAAMTAHHFSPTGSADSPAPDRVGVVLSE